VALCRSTSSCTCDNSRNPAFPPPQLLHLDILTLTHPRPGGVLPPAAQMSPPKSDNLPKSVDFDQFMNKASLALSSHHSSLGRHLKSRALSAGNSRPEHNGAEKAKPSFSSLANTPSPHPVLRKSHEPQRKIFSQPRARDNEDEDNDEAPDNSGVGHMPEDKGATSDARTAETRDLKGKLLGRRAMEQREEARKKRARAKQDSSDEEEGRSMAVSKGRKKKKGRSPSSD
jgi:hypothetical protein